MLYSDDSSADSLATATIKFSESTVKVSGSTTATLTFTEADSDNFEKVSYVATLKDSKGVSMGETAISTSYATGESSSTPYTRDITVNAPKTAGVYTLEVVFTETYAGADREIKVVRNLDVREPITLSVTVTNKDDSSLSITDGTFYFYLDGKRLDDSVSTTSIAIGGSHTFTYEIIENLKSGPHTYKLDTAGDSYSVDGLGKEYTFYYNQGSTSLYTYIMVIIFIVVALMAVWVYRKPVKNYGKPKARR